MGSTVTWSMTAVQPHAKMARAIAVSGSRCGVECHLLCTYIGTCGCSCPGADSEGAGKDKGGLTHMYVNAYVCIGVCVYACAHACVYACAHMVLFIDASPSPY